VALAGAAAIGQVAFASSQTEGDLLANLPGLDELPLRSLEVLLPVAAALASLVAAFLVPTWRRSGMRLAAMAGAIAVTGVGAVLWAHMAEFGLQELGRPTTAIEYHLPIWLVITASIAAVLLVLSLILLGIRYFFTFFTTVSMGGVAIGSMALVITLSVMSGFENDLRSKILGSNAHLLVTREDEAPFEDYQEVMKQIAHVRDVQAVTPHLTSEVVIAGASNYWNVIIKGIDPDSVAEVTKLGKDLEDPASLEQLIPQLEPDDEAGVDPDRTEPDAPAEPESDPDLLDPAPEDLEVGDVGPIDLSGGLTDMPEDPEAPETEERELIIDSIEDPEDGWEPPPHPLAPEVAALPGVLVGRELVTQINLYTSQEVKVISPLGQNTVAGQTPYIKPYRVAGVFYTGMYEYDLKLVYVELSTLQDFLDLPDVASGIEIRVGNPARTESVLADLRELLGPTYQVRDWKELNRSLFSALKLEKIAMFLVLAIIILVASFSIVGNLIMVVIEKAREIAVLKTLGASDSGVTRVFIVQGFFIGVIGTTIGVSLGLGASYLLDYFGLPITKDVYYIDRLPVHVDLVQVALVGLAGMAISVAATIYPARIAARLRPVQGLRYE
jgi:lipoprotein-releasing system permease protein